MNTIVCDASSLISMSENCLFTTFLDLSKHVSFKIPTGVHKEIIDNPLNSRRFEFKAMMLKSMFEDNLEVIDTQNKEHDIQELLRLANSLFYYKKHPIKIVHRGEAEAIICLLNQKEKYLLIDERTTRLLIEDMDKLKDYIENRTKKKLRFNKEAQKQLRIKLKGINVIRSVELFAYAYESGIVKNKKWFIAGLWALKFAGCSITTEEINEYEKMFA